MLTPSQKLARTNALSNQYRREAQKLGIASPYRQGEFIRYRLQGKSTQDALLLARYGRKGIYS